MSKTLHTPSGKIATLAMDQERAWIEGLRAGNFEIYQAVFEYFTPELVRFARLSVPRDAAEDVVQDVMFNLWQLRETISTRDGLAPYLFGAVRNRVANWRRHEHVVQRTEEDLAEERPPGMGELPQQPDAGAIASDFEAALRKALRRLFPMQKEVLTLRWEHEMSYEQIAVTLSISVAAAQKHGSRGLQAIRPLLERITRPRS
jgi:RNA polymerase sigma-70 factor (ECF subfamily)